MRCSLHIQISGFTSTSIQSENPISLIYFCLYKYQLFRSVVQQFAGGGLLHHLAIQVGT